MSIPKYQPSTGNSPARRGAAVESCHLAEKTFPEAPPFASRRAGFTLVELLLVVGITAILATVGTAVVANIRESTRVSKLESDVAAINAAIQIYQVSGGTLSASATADQVLTKLKTTASAATAATIPGLRGSLIDRRMSIEPQTAAEAASGQARARWEGFRFSVVSSGPAGVKSFILIDSLAAAAPATEDRVASNKTGTGTWVWNFTDAAPTAGTGPTAGPGTSPGTTGISPTAPTPLELNAPLFSQGGGSVPLINFDLSLTLSNPNPPGTSQIFYSVNGASMARYDGQTIPTAPGTSISAFSVTSDPDRWIDSVVAANTYTAVPVTLSVSLTVPVTNLTYAQAGGAMTGGTPQTAAPVTVSLNSAPQIPTQYLSSAKFQVYYTLDGTSPLTAGTAGPAFSGTYGSPSINVSPTNWGGASSLAIRAAARAIDVAMFANSPVVTASIGIVTTALAAPTIDPPSGSKAADLPVSIALAADQSYPVSTRIYYTLDGTDPGNAGGNPARGTLYSGQFSSGAGTNGVVVVTARVYGPAGMGQWFTPSPSTANTYQTITLADGALVGSANLNGTFVGSLVYASPPSGGTMSSITFNSGAKIMSGNLYLPGQPSIRRTNGTVWSVANDGLFASIIQGWEFDANGGKTVQTTPRVLDETGSITPNNYSVTFNNSALLEGKVIRRHTSPAFPVIAPPGAPDSNGSTSLNTHPTSPISASQYSSVTLNSAPVGDVRLNAGHYANLIANNGTAFVLGDPLHPEITQVYSLQSLTLNSGGSLKVVGKAIITIGGTINISNASVLGDPAHPEWLQLQLSSGAVNANSGSAIYGQLVAPSGSVSFNAGSSFHGSVTAQTLTINSNGIVFDLPPIIQN